MKVSRVTSQELADATGIPRHSIDNMRQRDSAAISLERALKIAAFFGTDPVTFASDPLGTNSLGEKQKNEALGLFTKLPEELRDVVLTQMKMLIATREKH